ncbi:hypothetical protein [Streptomyces cyaneofuscatus]
MTDDQTPEDGPEYDPAEQAAAEDGFTSLAAYLAQHPMPRQRDRSAA